MWVGGCGCGVSGCGVWVGVGVGGCCMGVGVVCGWVWCGVVVGCVSACVIYYLCPLSCRKPTWTPFCAQGGSLRVFCWRC